MSDRVHEKAPSKRTRAALKRAFGSLLFSLACLAAFIALAWFFTRVFAPERQAAARAPFLDFDATVMDVAVTPGAVAATQAEVLALGSRYLGQPGAEAAADTIKSAFEANGLEVHEQTIQTVAPRTAYSELYLNDVAARSTPHGERLANVALYPLMPNHFQPVVTPPEGVEGELVLLDPPTLGARRDFRDVIGVLEATPASIAPDFGYHWPRYAKLGVKAIILAHRQGLGAIDWQAQTAANTQTHAMVSSVPVNYPRLAANERIFDHLGRRVRLRVRVDFGERPNRTLFGVLRAKRPANEAVVFYAPHDAAAILPDLAPGALPALNTAFMLQLMRGLVAARSTLERDVIFMSSGSSVMGEDGLNHVLRVLQFNSFAARSNRLFDALGPLASERADEREAGAAFVLRTRLGPIEERETANEKLLAALAEARTASENANFLVTREATKRALDVMSSRGRAFLEEQFQYVVNTIVFERQEPVLKAKLVFERAGATTGSPSFAEYLPLRQKLDAANASAGSPPLVLLERSADFAREAEVARRFRDRLEELRLFHERRRRELREDREIAALFSPYREVAIFRPQLAPKAVADERAEVLSIYAKSARETQSVDLLLADAARRIAAPDGSFRVEPIATTPVEQTAIVERNVLPAPVFHYYLPYATGYQNMTWVNLGRQPAYQKWAWPTVHPFMTELDSLRGSFASLGRLALYLAHGNGLFGSPQGYPWQRRSYGGRVLVSNVGQSVVPSYPLKGALIGARPKEYKELHSRQGYWAHPFYMTDVYGKFDLPEQAADFAVWWQMYSDGAAYTPLAAGFGGDGLIAYMKDEGDEGQRLFKSVMIPLLNQQLVRDTTIVTFRAAPLSILDLTNALDFKDYSATEMITSAGLTPFGKSCQYLGPGFVTTYLPPDKRASALLKAGRPDNEHVRDVRAFLLNPDERGGSLTGRGYLVADNPLLLNVPFEAGESLAHVNGQRLALQNRYGLADDRTRDYHRKTLTLLDEARSGNFSQKLSTLRARDATSYAALNHPVLRESVFEAVVGILWYLGLLVPFVYFAEKLVFAFSDVRRQIAAQAVIFLSVFGLLRLLHPAFEMVRSSLMILLGFVIVLISVGITILFSSTARENFAELRQRQGKVDAAGINTLGVLTSSFLVGLNSMHRRRVRTGLTAATLTLLTFVMICFTSTENDLVDETTTLGRAEYQGLLARHDDFFAMTDSELSALKTKFGERFVVAERRFFIGHQEWNERKRLNPSLTAAFQRTDGLGRVPFSSILKLTPEEPLRNKIRLLTRRGWFLPEHAQDDGKPCPVLLPEKLAERLGVRPEAVDSEDVAVTINDIPFRVWGIFAADSLDRLTDLNGIDLLPFDIERVSSVGETSLGGFTASEDEPRIPAERIVITPVRDLNFQIANGNEVIASVAVDMGKANLREARTEILGHLEKTAQPAFYGMDGVSYRGLRTRKLTLGGLLELLIPLLIAGLTVLNTMKGSVYERRGEIYVYNAVGIAPRYILVMFLAEAIVYVVLGSVLGYLLSQGVGRVLSELGLTGGLRMTFASLTTIYASLAIAAAVFVSTWFPARSAMDIAAPAEESGWKLPEPDGDRLQFDLPFNFGARDRVAILAFFERWLLDHGEGSAGRFFAGRPQMAVLDERGSVDPALVPEMRVSVWLKPFDLAVSQEMLITTPFDPETAQHKARLELRRLSGTRESWLRLNKSFVTALRRHFLHWRAVGETERQVMFAEARQRLEARYPEWAGPAPQSAVGA